MDEPITEGTPVVTGASVGAAGSGAADRTAGEDAPRHLRRGEDPDEPTGRRRWWLALGVVLLVVVGVLVLAWAIDTSSGQVARNVTLTGEDIGGLSEADLAARVSNVAEAYAATPVVISSADATYETTAGDIGLMVDQRATADAALDVDRDAFVLVRPFLWARSFLVERSAPLRFQVSSDILDEHIVELQGDDRTPAREPDVTLGDDGLELVPGEPGRGIDPGDLAEALRSAAATASATVRVEVEPSPIAPRASDAVARAALADAVELTDEPIELTTPAGAEEVPPEVLRQWVSLRTENDGSVTVVLDAAAVGEDLRNRFTDIEGGPVDARFAVEAGRPVIIPDEPGLVCCAEGSAERIIDALRLGEPSVELELGSGEADFRTEDAEALGIVEEIGSPDAFGPTTHHACCESRVQNIHRMADLVRGVVIRPGEVFSINEHVGRRTREKGFTDGGAIANGVFVSAVGGGVSQFATTLFNAALYAGLDFDEYQAHSIYIDRYPRGHEATLSYPRPDLKIRNDTPYGVLIWPEYDDTTIRVRLYSTRHIEVQVGDPTASPAGRCTRWTTPRTRTYPDGRVERDSVFARYRPAEGVNC